MIQSSLPLRFWSKVQAEESCWIWTASRRAFGYGQFGVRAGVAPAQAHRLTFTDFVGPIGEGLEIDHLCRTPACVNPRHLEAVTHRENLLRGKNGRMVTHCPRGHEYTAENTYIRKDTGRGIRMCRSCSREKYHERKAATRGD